MSIYSNGQIVSNQKLLSELDNIKSGISDYNNINRIKTIVTELSDINEKLRGINECALFMLCNVKAKDSISKNNKYDLVKFILDKGANPNILNQTSQIPPLFIIEEEDIFDLLIDYKADVNFNSEYVHIFNQVTTCERVRKVLDLGLSAKNNTNYGNLYIHIFLNQMDTLTLNLLLDRFPEMATEYDYLGWNFTHYASSGIRVDLLNILLDRNIKLDLKTLQENGGNYGYDNGIKLGSDCADIVKHLRAKYIAKIGIDETNKLIERITGANNVYTK